MFETTQNLYWQFWYLLSMYRNSQVSIPPMVKIDPHHFVSPPTLLLSLLLSVLLPSLSLSYLPYLPVWFIYLSSIHIKTWRIWCMIIIDLIKLIEVTILFHLGIAYNNLIHNSGTSTPPTSLKRPNSPGLTLMVILPISYPTNLLNSLPLYGTIFNGWCREVLLKGRVSTVGLLLLTSLDKLL